MKKNLFKKVTSIAMSLCLSATLLAGCGSGGGGAVTPTIPSGGGGGGSSATSYDINVEVNTSNKTWIQSNVNNGDKLWFWTQDGRNIELINQGSTSNTFKWSGKLNANDEIVGFYITNSSGTGYKDFSVSATHVVTANWNVNYYVDNDDKMILNS